MIVGLRNRLSFTLYIEEESATKDHIPTNLIHEACHALIPLAWLLNFSFASLARGYYQHSASIYPAKDEHGIQISDLSSVVPFDRSIGCGRLKCLPRRHQLEGHGN